MLFNGFINFKLNMRIVILKIWNDNSLVTHKVDRQNKYQYTLNKC